MKLVTFAFGDEGPRAGAAIGDLVLDIAAAQPFLPPDTGELLRRGLLPEVQNMVDNASEFGREHFRHINDVAFFPPVLRPGKIICLGLNYRDHAEEQGKRPPEKPVLFAKAPTALAGPFDDIVIPRGIENVDAEAELALVIGREAKDVSVEEASDYIAGYMALNDVSARKAQKEDGQWFRAKSFDTFAPCGPWIVTPDEIGDPGNLHVSQRLNGKAMQSGSTSMLIHDIPSIIAYITAGMTLMPGDIISTGTPAGVGVFRDPPVFLKEGDTVEIEIGRIGILRNVVRRETG